MQILHGMVKDFRLLYAEFQITHTTLHVAAVHEITWLDLAVPHAIQCVQTSPAPKIFRNHTTCFCVNKNYSLARLQLRWNQTKKLTRHSDRTNWFLFPLQNFLTIFISVKEAKLFLCAIKLHGINTLARMEFKFHTFLTLVLDVGEFSASRPHAHCIDLQCQTEGGVWGNPAVNYF